MGQGKAVYATALVQGHEGLVAKHLTSTYRPGRRAAAWRKIKPRGRQGCQAHAILSKSNLGVRKGCEIAPLVDAPQALSSGANLALVWTASREKLPRQNSPM